MNYPLVSIIVVSYNHSGYIKENLDSVKNQTYPNIQLIVADDASPDNSAEVFEQWLKDNNYPAEKNFHSQNTGFTQTLNECIELAKGEYIKIIAADDVLHPEYTEECVSRLEALGESYGMVFTNTHTIDDSSHILQDYADYDALGNVDPQVFKKELIKGNRIAALSVLLRTAALKATGKYDTKFIVEDYFRWLKINEKYLIAYVPKKLTYYRLHAENISKVKADRIEKETLLLQIMFDKDGDVRQKINSLTQRYYLKKDHLSPEFIEAYQKYPYHIKRLSFALQYKVAPSLYKILNKII
ncbi:glycosyltransferase family 2 protein [Chryseobacterium indologenes]|uniref:glycosyltransferase family 2 protein n=1 Tax=Chryseobacterium indologenes TaxID=253 RepID=UPI0016297FC9|nr:glycosyltransferase family 2 protein [Chryseobacterium indologenes]